MCSRCCQKHTWCVSPPGRQIKLMPCSPPPAHQLLLVHAAIEKLTSSKQNKWQHTTKGREWTGPNGAVFKEDLSVGLYHQRRVRQKKGPWFESSLGNWGSDVWNASLYACVISHPASPPATGHTICLCSQCLNYVFPFSWKRERERNVVPLEENNKLTFWVCLSNCYLIVAGLQGELISAFLSLLAAGPAVHKARGCHTHSVCSTWANRL